MSTDPTPDRPWGEEQWEKLMRESEARSARYGELLETLIDHPDRDQIIEREMGWNRDAKQGDAPAWDVEELSDLDNSLNDPPSDEDIAAVGRMRDDVEAIPAYAESSAWSRKVFHALKNAECGDDDLDELLAEAIGEGHSVAAKIAGGHGIGYEDDAICGNIVRCRHALESADLSLRALQELSDGRMELSETLAPLIEQGRRIRQLVEDRIAELRSRVWWE